MVSSLARSVMETEGTNIHTYLVDAMDPCVNNKPSAIEEPSQNAEAEGTNTECEAGVDGQLSVSQSPINPPAHAKSKSHKKNVVKLASIYGRIMLNPKQEKGAQG